jgi:parallel beta-helix repeat protein
MRSYGHGMHLTLLVIVAGLLFLILSGEGAVLTVCPSGCDHSSIQAAIDKADPGDIIKVHSGTYRENVNVHKPHLTLQGVDTGAGRPVVDAGGDGSAVTLNASGSVLEGFEVANSGVDLNAGILIISNRNVVRDNLAKNNNGYGILFENSRNNVITHNKVEGNLRGLGVRNSSDNAIFLNVFADNGANAVSLNSTNFWSSSDPITYRYNGGIFTNRLGNHWSDYTGFDIGDDGIGEALHFLELEQDEFPLIMAGLRPEILVDKTANITSGAPGTGV